VSGSGASAFPTTSPTTVEPSSSFQVGPGSERRLRLAHEPDSANNPRVRPSFGPWSTARRRVKDAPVAVTLSRISSGCSRSGVPAQKRRHPRGASPTVKRRLPHTRGRFFRLGPGKHRVNRLPIYALFYKRIKIFDYFFYNHCSSHGQIAGETSLNFLLAVCLLAYIGPPRKHFCEKYHGN
jgi:hypothetical protein